MESNHNIVWGSLKHGWLENQVINKSEDDVVFLWRGPRWPALDSEFSNRFREAKSSIENMEGHFSTARMVDDLQAFKDFPVDFNDRLKNLLHSVYLECSGILERKASLSELLAETETAFERFRADWDEEVCPDGEKQLRASWRFVLNCARRLRDELDGLPAGPYLP